MGFILSISINSHFIAQLERFLHDEKHKLPVRRGPNTPSGAPEGEEQTQRFPVDYRQSNSVSGEICRVFCSPPVRLAAEFHESPE
jgi:hypothetical protein